ncbi:DUF7059 domain-containing protein [Brachybacterium tyrofermentans]|uniref:DUF7059 domain-containing protein n=1 Tax=Brachybacterium tyrofermentans TaxID=47848 RepID=UPI003FD0C6C7
MSPDISTAPPQALPDQVAALRADLRTARYTVEATESLLGPVALAALRRENPIPARRALAAQSEPAAVLFRLFVLGDVVPYSLVRAVLPALGADGALQLGLVGPASLPAHRGEDDHEADDPDIPLGALVDLAPYSASDDAGEISWWIASDLSELATGRALGPEHVLGVGGASLTLARITPRASVGRVLDLGCGGGIQALHASRHAEHVVATDLSERALAFAAFNAALNEVDLELRQGSLLDPVAGETFDLIVSNPPFVITPRRAAAAPEHGDEPTTPETTWTYRDGGRAGDTLLAELLTGLPVHLAPGGSAVMLGNWEIPHGGDWDEHPRAWLAAASADGVDSWVIQREQEDPAQYAETWVRDGGVTDRDPRWSDLQGAWLDDFAGRDVEGIGFGYLLLRRPAGPDAAVSDTAGTDSPGSHSTAPRPGVLRTEEATGTGTGTLGVHLAESLRALDVLHEMDDDSLAARRLVRADDVVERRHLTPGQWDPMLIELVQGAGFARTVRADQVLAGVVGALDGTLTLAQVLAAVCALTDADPDEARDQVLPVVRDLVRTGMVQL